MKGAIILASILTFNLHAYRLNTVAQKGSRWAQLPVYMEINPTNSGLSATETERALSAAMSTWNSGVGYEVLKSNGINTSVAASKILDRDSKNVIGFSDNFYLDSSGFDSDLVVAIGGQYGNGSEMSDAFILFNSEMVAWDTDKESSSSRGLYSDDLETVVLHEFGHVLGLGHSELYNAVMSAQRSQQVVRSLTQDDTDGAKFLTGASAQGGSAYTDGGGCGLITDTNSTNSSNNNLIVILMMLLPGLVLVLVKKRIKARITK